MTDKDKKKKTAAAGSDAGRKPPAPRKRASRARKPKDATTAAAEAGATQTADHATAFAPAPDPAGDASAVQAPVATTPPEVPGAIVPALIRVPLSVRWRDLDAFNHVNNSKFLSYLEEARLRWMVTLPGRGMDDHVAPVVAAAHLNYRRPIEWPNEIDIELFVERLGNTSLSIGHRIVGADDPDALYCDGNVVLVWIHRETGQPAALPEPVRSACSPR